MSILDRIILRRLALGVALATLLVAALTLLLQLARVGYHVRAAELAPLVVAALPSLVAFALPFGLTAAVIESYGHLQSTNQLEAMRAAGASRARLARPALLCTMVCLVASLGLSRLEPAALARLSRQLSRQAVALLLSPGRFVALGDDRTFYARTRDRASGELFGVLLAQRRSLLLAERGQAQLAPDGRVRVVLRHAELQQRVPHRGSAATLRRVRFSRLVFDLDLGRAIAPHVGFVARVLADPRRLASPPLWLTALGLIATAAVLRSRSRLRAALWSCALGGAFVSADIVLSALTPALWPAIGLVSATAAGVTIALYHAKS